MVYIVACIYRDMNRNVNLNVITRKSLLSILKGNLFIFVHLSFFFVFFIKFIYTGLALVHSSFLGLSSSHNQVYMEESDGN